MVQYSIFLTDIHVRIILCSFYTEAVVNPRRACAARVTVVVLCVCVLVCPIEILRMARLSIEMSHVLCIKSNYLQNGYVVCCKTLSFLRYRATSASGSMATPIKL